MPELPEAETIVRSLAPRIQGQTIIQVTYPGRRVWRSDVPNLIGRRIQGVRRYGKQVLIEFDQGWLLVRLGMTGALLVDRAPSPYTRAELHLTNTRLLFDDIRQFGWFELLEEPPARLGPDPLEIADEDFVKLLRARSTRVKTALLDQKFLRGVGNIYADEALFRAGIQPEARTERLTKARAQRLLGELRELLEDAIRSRGSSISDYVDADGEKGSFQLSHRVYGKAGHPCLACGALIRRIVVSQRGTHFCPACQKL